MLIQKGAVRKPHLPALGTAKLTHKARLGNRTYRLENRTNKLIWYNMNNEAYTTPVLKRCALHDNQLISIEVKNDPFSKNRKCSDNT